MKYLNLRAVVYVVLVFFSFISAHLSFAEKETKKSEEPKKEEVMAGDFESIVGAYEKNYRDTEYLYSVAQWNAYLHSDDEGMNKIMNIYEEKLNDLINDEENFKKVKALYEDMKAKNETGKEFDITEKWFKFLDKIIVLDPAAKKLQKDEMELKNKLASIWNVYRPKMKDKKGNYILDEKKKEKLFNGSEIVRILSTSKDRDERKRAFEARSSVGFELLQNGFKDLIKLRNEFAKTKGFENYYEMRYALGGFDIQKLFAMFDKIVSETDDITKKAVDSYVAREKLDRFEPYDVEHASMGFTQPIDKYLTKEGMVGALKESFKNLGFDLDNPKIKMDLEPRPGKFPHAACWWVKFSDPSGEKWTEPDIRLMANLDKGGMDQYGTLFHETGHAVHGANIKQVHYIDQSPGLPYYHDMGGLTEGIAMTFEKIPEELDWFLKYEEFDKKGSGIKKVELKKVFEEFDKNQKLWGAFNLRVLLTKVYFEREIYANPDSDLNKAWWDQMERLLFVVRHDDIPHWAHKMHFITHPAYYQFYVLADLISEQTLGHLKKKYGKIVDNKNVGLDLINAYFLPGNTLTWEEMIKNLTGEELTPQYKIDSVTKF